MIISVWKPKYNRIDGIKKVVLYTKIDNDLVINIRGFTLCKVLWKCDSNDCKFKNKLHSVDRHHMIKDKFNYNIQICHSCQLSGEGNPRFGDNRKMSEFMSKERYVEYIKELSVRNTNNNTSKLESTKIKKGQFIVNFENVEKLISKENFKLVSIIGSNKNAKLKIMCSENHIYETKYHSWKRGNRCKRCFYDTLLIDKGLKKDFEYYRLVVNRFTQREVYKYKIITKKDQHIDHKLSVKFGFDNNIPPFIVGSIHNLEVIDSKLNMSKGSRCSITKEFLFESFYFDKLPMGEA